MFAGLVVAASLAALVPSVGFAQRAVPGPMSGGGLITHATAMGEHKQQMTVIDPDTRTMAVYHITDGEITLKSVRNIHYDMQMIVLNGTKPLPQEIRSLVEQTK